MSDEERSREDELVKLWADRLQDKTSDPRLRAAVTALMQKRQQRELEDLMHRLALDKAMAVKQQLLERHAKGDKDVSIAAIQADVRQKHHQSDLARIAELEDAHVAQLQAAMQACCATNPTEQLALHYDTIEQRRQAIADELRTQQAERATTVADERKRILADSSLSEEEKVGRIAELLAGLGRFDDKVEWEKRRQEAEMARKMEERKKRKADEEERRTKEKEEKEAEKRKKKEKMQTALQEERKELHEQQQQLHGSSTASQSDAVTAASSGSSVVAVVDPAMTERLQRIESTLLAMQSASTTWRETAYIDPLDATDPRYLHDTELVVVEESDMQPSVRFLHQFAVSFLRLVHALPSSSTAASLPAAVPPLTVHLASSLPASTHPSCTYRNSFHYVPGTRSLYIRKERAEDVGAFLCVLISAVAHVVAETEAREEVRKRKAKQDRIREKAIKQQAEQQQQQQLQEEGETKDGEAAVGVLSAEELAREEARQRWEAESSERWNRRGTIVTRASNATCTECSSASWQTTSTQPLHPQPPTAYDGRSATRHTRRSIRSPSRIAWARQSARRLCRPCSTCIPLLPRRPFLPPHCCRPPSTLTCPSSPPRACWAASAATLPSASTASWPPTSAHCSTARRTRIGSGGSSGCWETGSGVDGGGGSSWTSWRRARWRTSSTSGWWRWSGSCTSPPLSATRRRRRRKGGRRLARLWTRLSGRSVLL